MKLRKLSLAAVISVGVMAVGIPASFAADSCPAPKTSPAPASSAYGAGAAGTFKASGTLPTYGGNSAGATEIQSMKSPESKPTGAAAAMAQQGIYGNCAPCPTGAAAPILLPQSTVTIQKQVVPPGSGCPSGAAAQVATPKSSITSPQISKEQGNTKCVQPSVKIPVTQTGAACPVAAPCPTTMTPVQPVTPVTPTPVTPVTPMTPGTMDSMMPMAPVQPVTPVAPTIITPVPSGAACPVPSTDANRRTNAGAPSDFSMPLTPGAAAPINEQMSQMSAPVATGEACPVTAPCPTAMPAKPVIPAKPMATGAACPVAAPCPIAVPAPVAAPQCGCPSMQQQVIPPASTSYAMPAAQNIVIPQCPTGGAVQLSSTAASSTCAPITGDAEYAKRMVYAYPAMPAGMGTAVVPTASEIIGFGNNVATVPVNGAAMAFNQNQMASNIAMFPGLATGAAAPSCSSTTLMGTDVSRYPVYTAADVAPIQIQTANSLQITRQVLVPMASCPTGAAAPMNMFTDVSSGFWASEPINRLASAGIISGYPNKTFKPAASVTRAEFATMLVSGLNLQPAPSGSQMFRDVPSTNWASSSINSVSNRGLIAGYPDSTFRPNDQISRAEALTTMSRSVNTNMSLTEANQVLLQYQDAASVPAWARIPVAQAIKAGLLNNSPNSGVIDPNSVATRAQVANMISNLRQTLALDKPAQPTGAAVQVQQQTVNYPTLNVKFNDRVNSRTSNVNDKFTASTLEQVTINGITYPAGSQVNGRVVEVVRPGNGQNGAIKVAFSGIQNGTASSPLPREVITAQVSAPQGVGILTKLVEFPFVWAGRLVGITGRTVGGTTVVAGNTSEQFLSGLGESGGNAVRGEWSAAGRSLIGSGTALAKLPLDVTRTAIAGAAGLLNVSSDEIAYLTSGRGETVASINPDETVSIAFGCR